VWSERERADPLENKTCWPLKINKPPKIGLYFGGSAWPKINWAKTWACSCFFCGLDLIVKN
jgi:hypothetical protein